MTAYFAPVNKKADVKSVEMHHESLTEGGKPGDNVGFNIKGLSIKDINRGNVASDAKNKPAFSVSRFLAQVIVLNHNMIKDNYTPVLDCHTAHIACKFNTIVAKIDPRNGNLKEKRDPEGESIMVKKNEACLAVLTPTKKMCVEAFTEYPPLGRFAIRDMRKTVAVGVIKNIQSKEDAESSTYKMTGVKKKGSIKFFSHADDLKWAKEVCKLDI